ncbi:hypothetical protein [Streptosporangium jomthongense]|uniref:Uncharacterized protein n=1 Tax=Streptosporangium jomthongense TaxID=1193683 RepID=A0ABV8FAG4_9ACTN
MPQQTSATREPGGTRRARWSATSRRVDCSRPFGVKYITPASAPNFSTARRLSPVWVSAAEVRSAS